MLGAIVYRHWLELRFRVLAALLPWGIVCVATAVLAVSVTPMVSSLVVHAWALSLAVVGAGVVFGGTGIRAALEAGPRATCYALTLPVSRFTLAWTRLCVAAGIAFVVVFGVVVAAVAALLFAGHVVPIGSMAASMLLGLTIAVCLQAVTGLFLPLVTERFSPALLSLIPAGVVLAIVRTLNDGSTGWIHVVRFLMVEPTQWEVVGALVLVIAGSLAAAAMLVRVREF